MVCATAPHSGVFDGSVISGLFHLFLGDDILRFERYRCIAWSDEVRLEFPQFPWKIPPISEMTDGYPNSKRVFRGKS